MLVYQRVLQVYYDGFHSLHPIFPVAFSVATAVTDELPRLERLAELDQRAGSWGSMAGRSRWSKVHTRHKGLVGFKVYYNIRSPHGHHELLQRYDVYIYIYIL